MLKINLFCLTSILCFAAFISGCSTNRSQTIDPTNLAQLQNVNGNEPTHILAAPEISQLRVKALQDTAMSLAAQGGLAWASQQINARLEHDKWSLETTYNFNAMMLNHGVLPPILQEGDNSLNLADPNTIRVADKTYRILQQARFATTPPNWREYLWMSYPKPEMPAKFLLPHNEDEQKIWRTSIDLGWDKGIQQAYSIFQQNLARLKRDFQGMLLYRKLLEEKMISAPFVSRTELGVTGNGSDMRINDQVLRITQLPALQTDANRWNAIVVKE